MQQATLSYLDRVVQSIGPGAPLRIYLAGHDRFGDPLPPGQLTAIERELAEIAGGCTVIRARGWWTEGDRPPIAEPVRIVEIYFLSALSTQQRTRLSRCLAGILHDMNQKVLAIAVNGQFVLIPRLAAPGDDEHLVLVG